MNYDDTVAIRNNIESEFERHQTKSCPLDTFLELPARRYTDPHFHTLEAARVWGSQWLFAGHTDELRNVGDFKLWRASGAPVILVRGIDGEIRGFYNTCRHRGGPLVREAGGHVSRFICKYHAWSYSLDGDIIAIPDEHEFPGIDKSLCGLIPVQVSLLGQWIFVNFSIEPSSLRDQLGDIVNEFDAFEPDSLHLVHHYGHDVACNWKVAVDAFLEVYHVRFIHQRTVDKDLDARGAHMTLFTNGNSRMIVPKKSTSAPRPSIDSAQQARIERPEHMITRETALSYFVFPNLFLVTGEYEWPFVVIWPTGIRTCRFEVWWWGQEGPSELHTEAWQKRIAHFESVLKEDVENLAWIQESLETPGFRSVPLSYQERRIYHFNEQLDQVIGLTNVPEGMSVRRV